jgi:hypothetical protein
MVVVSAASLALALADVIANWNHFLLGSMFLAGFITALAASTRRVLLALAQVVPALLTVFVLFAIGVRYDPRWENVGLEGAAIRALLISPTAAILCAAGGGLGWLLARRGSTPNTSLERTRER